MVNVFLFVTRTHLGNLIHAVLNHRSTAVEGLVLLPYKLFLWAKAVEHGFLALLCERKG